LRAWFKPAFHSCEARLGHDEAVFEFSRGLNLGYGSRNA
jgi:hypothetical protein